VLQVDAALKKDIRIAPNPIAPGNTVKVKLALSKQGDYKVELLNPGGQVMLTKGIWMGKRVQTINITTQSDWAAGVYWLRASMPGSSKVTEAKLVLQ
jgi:hypothetical protein